MFSLFFLTTETMETHDAILFPLVILMFLHKLLIILIYVYEILEDLFSLYLLLAHD